MSIDYVKTIQWVLFYYHDRKFSWTHQYPYKCAPFAGDFVGVHRMTFSMDFDKPVNVFTHLLAILPKSSANLLPKPYHQYMSEEMDEMEDLCQKSTLAEKHLTIDEKERNALKTMLRIRYVQSEDDKNKVEISTISNNKNKNSPQRSIDRPIDRNNFNFMFSTLTLHDFSGKIIQSLLKPYPRMVITLHDDKLPNIETVAKEYLNEIVYVGWPHYFEAKVMQVFDANKKIHASSVDIDLTQSSDEFNACNDNLMSRFGERGIDVGKIQFIAYVAPLKWMEYEATENNSNSYRLTKRWADKWEPVAVQTMIKSCIAIKVPTVKHVADVLCIPNAFLFGGNSNCYGEIATIAATDEVEKTGRVNIMCYLDQDPNFDKAKETYTASKMNQLNQYKTANTAATLLGISSKTFARITGAVLVNAVNSVENSPKINIGLRLKSRSLFHINVRVLDGYVKSRGKEFIYSQLAIDLVQEYLNKFPRVFELISMSDAKVLLVSDFDQNNNQNGLEYVGEIRKWIGSLPHSKMTHKISDSLKLNDDAIRNVQEAVCAMYEVEPKLIKLKMKWQNLYIPDMNNVFAIPCPNASYKLLDRVMVVRSGYPVPVGSKGTVIGIDPMHYHTIGDDITESDLYGLDILMDSSFTIQSKACPFQRHNVFRIHSTNMIINISHGRSK